MRCHKAGLSDKNGISRIIPMDGQYAPEHAGLHIALDDLLSVAVLALPVYYT